jgi:hypothetical protein
MNQSQSKSYARALDALNNLAEGGHDTDDTPLTDLEQVELEKNIGIFLAKTLMFGKSAKLSELHIQEVVAEYLNAFPKDWDGFYANFNASVSDETRKCCLALFHTFANMGVDFPDTVYSSEQNSDEYTMQWRTLPTVDRRDGLIEITIRGCFFVLRSSKVGKPYGNRSEEHTTLDNLNKREFFEKLGLCAKAAIASDFNPLRAFNK